MQFLMNGMTMMNTKLNVTVTLDDIKNALIRREEPGYNTMHHCALAHTLEREGFSFYWVGIEEVYFRTAKYKVNKTGVKMINLYLESKKEKHKAQDLLSGAPYNIELEKVCV